MTDQTRTEEEALKPTLGEHVKELFSRVAKLNDQMAAVLAPEWGARMGILPEGHPLRPELADTDPEEQSAPVDWDDKLAEARLWARHGYEIGQRHCSWTDHGVAPAWLTEGWPHHFDSCEHLKQAAEYDETITRVRAEVARIRAVTRTWWPVADLIDAALNRRPAPSAPDFTSPLAGRIEVRDPCPWCESSPALIPRVLMDEHVATVHPEVRTLDTTDPADLTGYLAPDPPIRCLTAATDTVTRPRCPHCQMPHDLEPGSLPVTVCESIRRRLAEAARLHDEGDHSQCCRADCDVLQQRDQETDQLRAELDRAHTELQQYAENESADAAAGSYAGRVEELEGALHGVREIHQPVAGEDDTRWCQVCSQEEIQPPPVGWWVPWPCPTLTALDPVAHAIAQPEPWLHVDFTSPDATTANTSALNLRDHLAAEFDGVGMRITSNAGEAATAKEG